MAPTDCGGDTDEGDVALSVDAIMDVLSHRQRREMLRALRERGGIPDDELVGRLQELEEGRTGQQPSRDDISATLHHVHEPKLGEAALLTYDEGAGEYRYHSNDHVEQWLDHIEAVHEDER